MLPNGGRSMVIPDDRDRINQLTQKIIGCAYEVSNFLGAGFLEKVYENALAVEMRSAGLQFRQQHFLQVTYKATAVGEFVADFLVEDCVVVELKAVKALDDVHAAQCLNYLRATGLWVCLLINFAKPRLEYRRIVHGFLEEGTSDQPN
jgi:GxxExxY protein